MQCDQAAFGTCRGLGGGSMHCRAVGLLAAQRLVPYQLACKALQAVKRRSRGPQRAALLAGRARAHGRC